MAIDIFSVFKTYCGNNGGFVPTAYDDLSYEDKRRSGIYWIRHIENGKVYVGSAVKFSHRFAEHKTALRKGTHHSGRLQRAWDKYSEILFSFETIEFVVLTGNKKENKKLLLSREQHWINSTKAYDHNFGYNMRPIAGSAMGTVHSEETKEKLSKILKNSPMFQAARQAQIGVPLVLQHREAISMALTGKQKTPEHIANLVAASLNSEKSRNHIINMNAAKKGISLSDEHKEKISLFSKTNENAISHWKKILESQKGKPKSETHKDNLRISNIGKIRSKIARKNMSDGWAKRKASLPEGTPIMARPDDIGARISAGWAKRRERLTTEQAIKIMHEDEQLALLDIASCL